MRWAGLLIAVTLVGGCGLNGKIKKLAPREQDAYTALRVWIDEDDRKVYLKLKTEAERDKWLKSNGEPVNFYERWYKYTPAQQAEILSGNAKPGWPQDMLFMAWGEPHERSRLAGRPAERSELMLYRFEVQPDGSALVWTVGSKTEYQAIDKFTMEVYVDDGKIAELIEKKGWQ